MKKHKPWLPFDENRCKGWRDSNRRLRDDCRVCLRRTANWDNAAYSIQPKGQIDGKCTQFMKP